MKIRGITPKVILPKEEKKKTLLVDLYREWIRVGETEPKQKGGKDPKTLRQYASFVAKVESLREVCGPCRGYVRS